MAIFHNQTRIVSRQAKDKAGQVIPGKQVSSLAKAAYRSGDRLKDNRIDKTFDYRSRTQEVVNSGILVPENAPSWLRTSEEQAGKGRREQRDMREALWNAIEVVERRRDSQLCRDFELALPLELDEAQRLALLREWCQSEHVSEGFVVDYAIHRSKDGGNPHAHVLVTLRPTDENSATGFGKKPDMSGKFNGRGIVGHGAKADLNDWRETWAEAQNRALSAAGVEARVDHRSLEAQGIDRLPQTHKGVSATAMEKKGVATERGRAARTVGYLNQVKNAIYDIVMHGEVSQFGAGETWWERLWNSLEEGIDVVMHKAVSLLRDDRSGGSWTEREKSRREDRDVEMG